MGNNHDENQCCQFAFRITPITGKQLHQDYLRDPFAQNNPHNGEKPKTSAKFLAIIGITPITGKQPCQRLSRSS